MKFEGSEMLIIFSSLIILMVLMMMILIYVGFLRKKTELVLQKQQNELKFSQELALSQIEMREQTLSYVGRELHDDIGQKLSVAKMMTNKMNAAPQPDVQVFAKELSELLSECITDIRNLSKTFNTDQIEHVGLIDSIEREVQRIEKLDFITVRFVFNSHDIDINPKHALILFRMVQECLNNVLKHSRSKKLEIFLDDGDESLDIRIVDFGVGIPKNLATEGSGLRNIKNRASIIKAEFLISSELNEGTEIRIVYPKK